MEPTEFEIPVGWGHISGVTWGKESGFPMLCLHGHLDNAGTFDRLIPLLPKRFFYVAIDLPGHGRSSHFNIGHPFEFSNFLYSVKLVVNHFRWEKFYLLGHSFGAQISTYFMAIYPKLVVKGILIDGLSPSFVDDDNFAQAIAKRFDKYFQLECSLSKKSPPSYTFDDAVSRLIKGRVGYLCQEGARALAKRNLLISGDGFKFAFDQRLKLFPAPFFSVSQFMNILQSIECPCFFIVASNSLETMEKLPIAYYSKESLETLSHHSKFTMKVLKGHHDIHLNQPELVASHLNSFLNDTQSSL